MKLVWDEGAWEDYLWWQGQDRKTLKRINTLIKDIARNGNDGIGKPEPLRHGFQGYWSRRITEELPSARACRDAVIGPALRQLWEGAARRPHYDRLTRRLVGLQHAAGDRRDGPIRSLAQSVSHH